MLDEHTTNLLAQLAEAGERPLHEQTPDEVRAAGVFFTELNGRGPDVHSVREVSIDGEGGPIPLRILVPTDQPRGVIVYYHGGGWVVGSINEFDALGRHLAVRSGCTVVLVEYRLAPEHRYPAAVVDAWTALAWVASHAAELARPGGSLVVAGDSAGGNLAAVVAQRARGSEIAIALQVLIYPATDCDLDRPSFLEPDNQLFLDRLAMRWFWDHYVPDPELRTDPEISPLRADSLAGLPPAVVITAEHDPLRDEGEEYAQRLAAEGVPVEHRRFSGQMHGFVMFVGLLPASLEAVDWLVEVGEPVLSHA